MTMQRVLARVKRVMFILSVGSELYKYARSDS
jgi:hypothetical protein